MAHTLLIRSMSQTEPLGRTFWLLLFFSHWAAFSTVTTAGVPRAPLPFTAFSRDSCRCRRYSSACAGQRQLADFRMQEFKASLTQIGVDSATGISHGHSKSSLCTAALHSPRHAAAGDSTHHPSWVQYYNGQQHMPQVFSAFCAAARTADV